MGKRPDGGSGFVGYGRERQNAVHRRRAHAAKECVLLSQTALWTGFQTGGISSEKRVFKSDATAFR